MDCTSDIMGRYRAAIVFSLLLVSLGASLDAAAQRPVERGGLKIKAKRRFAAGKRHYDAGRYDKAIDEFVAAYQAWPQPEILFTLGQAHRLRNEYFRALLYYQQYLETAPDNTARQEAKEHIAALTSILEEEAAVRKEEARKEEARKEAARKEAARKEAAAKEQTAEEQIAKEQAANEVTAAMAPAKSSSRAVAKERGSGVPAGTTMPAGIDARQQDAPRLDPTRDAARLAGGDLTSAPAPAEPRSRRWWLAVLGPAAGVVAIVLTGLVIYAVRPGFYYCDLRGVPCLTLE